MVLYSNDSFGTKDLTVKPGIYKGAFFMVRTAELSFRVVVAIFLLVAIAHSSGSAQTGANAYVPRMTFDVASVYEDRPTDDYVSYGGFTPNTGNFFGQSLTFKDLLLDAYPIRPDQLVGETLGHSMFTVRASVDSAANAKLAALPPKQRLLEQQHMLQSLLADRFRLKTHWKTLTAATYDIVLVHKKSHLEQGTTQPAQSEKDRAGIYPVPSIYANYNNPDHAELIAHGASMDEIVAWLSFRIQHAVIDKTGLAGVYSFRVAFRGGLLKDRPPDDVSPVPTLGQALQADLGLKLKPSKGPVQYLVIDHVEKPTPN